jgi:hypothetical protein
MTPTAPITQDVLTIPRKLPEGKVNLVGLTREGLRAALIAHGTPERQAKMRVNQIWQWIYQWGVRDFAAMSNLAKGYRADLAERFVIEIPEVVNKQVIAARCAFPLRWGARSRAVSAIPARKSWCATSRPGKSSVRSCLRATILTNGPSPARGPESGRASSPTSC